MELVRTGLRKLGKENEVERRKQMDLNEIGKSWRSDLDKVERSRRTYLKEVERSRRTDLNEVEISRRTDLDRVERSRQTDFREKISRKRKKEVAENPEDSSKRNKWKWGRDFSTSGGKEHSFLKKDGLMGTGLLQNIFVESEQRRLGIWTDARNEDGHHNIGGTGS